MRQTRRTNRDEGRNRIVQMYAHITQVENAQFRHLHISVHMADGRTIKRTETLPSDDFFIAGNDEFWQAISDTLRDSIYAPQVVSLEQETETSVGC